MLARPHLMTLYVIFPIYVNFPPRSWCVFKAIIHGKKQWIVLQLLKSFFFFKTTLFYIVHASSIWLIFPFYHDLFLLFMFLYLSSINYFRHITSYTRGFFSIYVRDFPKSYSHANWKNTDKLSLKCFKSILKFSHSNYL